MSYKYATLASVIEATNEERFIDRSDVAPRVQEMEIWQGVASLSGGYMPHAHIIATRKDDCVDYLADLAADPETGRLPRGFKGELRRFGVASAGDDTFEVVRMTVSELF